MLTGIWGLPFIDLEPFVDLRGLTSLDREICYGLVRCSPEYTGGSHKSMGIVPPHLRDDPYADYGEVIARMSRDERILFYSLSDSPTLLDPDTPEAYTFGEERDVPLSRKQVKLLETRYGVYFPWKVFYELLPVHYWDEKSSGAGKTCADMCLYLAKHGFKDLHIFNRTLSKAEALVKRLAAKQPEAGIPAVLHGKREASVLFNNLGSIKASAFACPTSDDDKATLEIGYSPDRIGKASRGGLAMDDSYRIQQSAQYTKLKARIKNGVVESEQVEHLHSPRIAWFYDQTGDTNFTKGKIKLNIAPDGLSGSGLIAGLHGLAPRERRAVGVAPSLQVLGGRHRWRRRARGVAGAGRGRVAQGDHPLVPLRAGGDHPRRARALRPGDRRRRARGSR